MCFNCFAIFLLQTSDVIDFGKIIIYTSNLKIIRTPVINTEVPENTKWFPIERRQAGQRDLCHTGIKSFEESLVQQHTQVRNMEKRTSKARYISCLCFTSDA